MHRHGYQGRKFGRERGPRKALIDGLAESLVRDGSITTTRPKAKELIPHFEKLITRAKKGDLASRRILLKDLTVSSSHKLVDEIAPKLTGRTSGHLKLERAGFRRGDTAELAKVSFVDKLGADAKPVVKPATKATKPVKKDVESAKDKPEVKATGGRSDKLHSTQKQAAKRTGVRGNR